MDSYNSTILTYIITCGILLLGSATLIGVFKKMKGGFGPQNLRIVIIILGLIFITLLGCLNSDTIKAAVGLIGTIVGYIFGINGKSTGNDNEQKTS